MDFFNDISIPRLVAIDKEGKILLYAAGYSVHSQQTWDVIQDAIVNISPCYVEPLPYKPTPQYITEPADDEPVDPISGGKPIWISEIHYRPALFHTSGLYFPDQDFEWMEPLYGGPDQALQFQTNFFNEPKNYQFIKLEYDVSEPTNLRDYNLNTLTRCYPSSQQGEGAYENCEEPSGTHVSPIYSFQDDIYVMGKGFVNIVRHPQLYEDMNGMHSAHLEMYNEHLNPNMFGFVNLGQLGLPDISNECPQSTLTLSKGVDIIDAINYSDGRHDHWQSCYHGIEEGDLWPNVESGHVCSYYGNHCNDNSDCVPHLESCIDNISLGSSIQLKAPRLNSNDPNSWKASRYAGGAPNLPNDIHGEQYQSGGGQMIVISEVLYNPPDQFFDDNYEFLELYNRSDYDIDVGGFYFHQGIDFTFPQGYRIPAKERVVIAITNRDANNSNIYPNGWISPYYCGVDTSMQWNNFEQCLQIWGDALYSSDNELLFPFQNYGHFISPDQTDYWPNLFLFEGSLINSGEDIDLRDGECASFCKGFNENDGGNYYCRVSNQECNRNIAVSNENFEDNPSGNMESCGHEFGIAYCSCGECLCYTANNDPTGCNYYTTEEDCTQIYDADYVEYGSEQCQEGLLYDYLLTLEPWPWGDNLILWYYQNIYDLHLDIFKTNCEGANGYMFYESTVYLCSTTGLPCNPSDSTCDENHECDNINNQGECDSNENCYWYRSESGDDAGEEYCTYTDEAPTHFGWCQKDQCLRETCHDYCKGNRVNEIDYEPNLPWPYVTKGFYKGSSIQLKEGMLDNTNPNNWKASRVELGNPGTEKIQNYVNTNIEWNIPGYETNQEGHLMIPQNPLSDFGIFYNNIDLSFDSLNWRTGELDEPGTFQGPYINGYFVVTKPLEFNTGVSTTWPPMQCDNPNAMNYNVHSNRDVDCVYSLKSPQDVELFFWYEQPEDGGEDYITLLYEQSNARNHSHRKVRRIRKR
tara:strand:+ start:7415 stop:10339 length:2925 start_codon:yes stop_codon:yes gene_type:complete